MAQLSRATVSICWRCAGRLRAGGRWLMRYSMARSSHARHGLALGLGGRGRRLGRHRRRQGALGGVGVVGGAGDAGAGDPAELGPPVGVHPGQVLALDLAALPKDLGFERVGVAPDQASRRRLVFGGIGRLGVGRACRAAAGCRAAGRPACRARGRSPPGGVGAGPRSRSISAGSGSRAALSEGRGRGGVLPHQLLARGLDQRGARGQGEPQRLPRLVAVPRDDGAGGGRAALARGGALRDAVDAGDQPQRLVGELDRGVAVLLQAQAEKRRRRRAAPRRAPSSSRSMAAAASRDCRSERGRSCSARTPAITRCSAGFFRSRSSALPPISASRPAAARTASIAAPNGCGRGWGGSEAGG